MKWDDYRKEYSHTIKGGRKMNAPRLHSEGEVEEWRKWEHSWCD